MIRVADHPILHLKNDESPGNIKKGRYPIIIQRDSYLRLHIYYYSRICTRTDYKLITEYQFLNFLPEITIMITFLLLKKIKMLIFYNLYPLKKTSYPFFQYNIALCNIIFNISLHYAICKHLNAII